MALTYANQIGAISGLNQSGSGISIPEDFVRWGQDVLFDRNGLLRRRAPHTVFPIYNQAGNPTVTQPSVANERVVSAFSTLNPLGQRISAMFVTNDTASRILFLDANNRGTHNTSNASTVSVVAGMPRDCVFDVKNASTTGMWLSFLEQGYSYGSASNDYVQYYWRGGCGVESTFTGCTLAITGVGATSTYGNTITIPAGTFANSTTGALPQPGMFVYRTVSSVDYYLGTIISATSSVITLEKDIIRTTSGANADANTTAQTIKVVNVRPFIKTHGRGLISGTSGNAQVMVSGNLGSDAEGHWKSAGLDSTWALYRANDGKWIGDIGSVTDNSTLTISTTYFSTVTGTMKADEYTARQYAAVPSANLNLRSNIPSNSAGIFTATYAGLQWFGNAADTANRNRIVFSAYNDPEAVDLSANDADSIIIPGLSEMRGLASSSSGLLIFMADKTYRLRGNSRFNFSLEELYPEGCLSSMSIVEYGGGVFWASKTGIFLFDGTTVRNLSKDNLGLYYPESIKNYDPQVNRAYGFFHKDYLFMHFNAWKSIYNPIRYEPIYADTIDGTAAISGFTYNDWDPDFTFDDLSPNSNTPIYWNRNVLYSNSSGVASGLIGTWQQGVSFNNVSFTAASPNLTGLVANVQSNIFPTALAVTASTGTFTVPAGVTYNASTNPNGVNVNSWIRVVGVTPNGYNGTYRVSAITPTTIAYDNTTNSNTGFVANSNVYIEFLPTGPVISDSNGGLTALTSGYATNGTAGTGTTATITLAAGVTHSVRAAGEYVLVTGVTPTGYNGIYPVTSFVVPTTAAGTGSISYANTTTGAQTVAGNVFVLPNGPYFTGQGMPYSATTPTQVLATGAGVTSPPVPFFATTVTSGTGAIATITTSTAHGFTIGTNVVISGVTPLGYNGTYTILTVPTSTTFTYANTTTGAQTVAGTVIDKRRPTSLTMNVNTTAASSSFTTTSNPANIQMSNAPASFFWGALGYQYIWGPLNQTEGLTFAVYLPTGAISVISNFGFRGVIKQEAVTGLKAVVAANAVNPTEFSVVTKSSVGSVATITTSVPHGFSIGSSITVSGIDAEFNGNVVLLNISTPTTSASGSAGIATIGVGSGHPFSVGHTITVAGITPSGYNGTFTVTSTTSTSVSYVNATTGVQTVAGTITNNSANSLVYSKTVNSTFSPINVAPNGTAAQTGVYARLIDVDALLNINANYTTGTDEVLIENLGMSPNNYIKGPDFYMQTKHYSMGDPILKKWFRQLFLNLYLIDGAVRLDIVDNEDNDEIDITKKRHVNWETFGNVSFTWDKFEDLILPAKLSPNRSTWNNVELLVSSWYNITNTLYERRKQRMSWRYPTMGFRLYQMNNYRAPKFSLGERPFAVELESWDIGFKPMRASRV